MKINTMHILIAALILSASVLTVALVGFILGNKYLSSYQKRIDHLARHECAIASRVEIQETEKIVGSYPSSAYKDCLHEKGL